MNAYLNTSLNYNTTQLNTTQNNASTHLSLKVHARVDVPARVRVAQVECVLVHRRTAVACMQDNDRGGTLTCLQWMRILCALTQC